jgi:hypothetical protein
VKLSTQLAAVIVAGVLGMVGMIVGLAVLADWSDGAIIGMMSGIGSVLVTAIVTLRGQQKQAEVLESQNVTLDRVVEQTNGLSDRERQDIASRAAAAVIDGLKRSGQRPS